MSLTTSDVPEVIIHHPCGRLTVQPGWGRDRQTSLRLRDHELWFVWRGRGWMQTHDRRLDLRPGVCVWMRPGGVYDAGTVGRDGLGFTYIHFGWPTGVPAPQELYDVSDVGFFDAATRQIVQMVQTVSQLQWGEPARTPAAAPMLLRTLLTDLLERRTRRQPLEGIARQIQDLAMELRDHPEAAPPVAELAARCCVTPAHFSRQFKQQTGLSPQQYTVRARIERARHLLTESRLTVTQIAETLGYSDVYLFSKQFKRHTGLPPTAYRRG